MQVDVEELLRVIRPWSERHGFRCRTVSVTGDARPRVEIETSRRLLFEAYALDAFGNVGVDVDTAGVRRAYTGPLPDLQRLLDEARAEIERPAPPKPFDLS